MAAPSNKLASIQSNTPPAPGATAVRLEKSHPGVRRSTPDSEALASSDDDGDHIAPTQTTAPQTKPVRRPSWLNEVPLGAQRKSSLPGGPLAAGPSNPASPSGDQAPWATNPSPGLSGGSFNWNQAGSSSFPWGTGIWNTESRKEPPSRLSEIVPSPTMTNPPPSSGNLADDMLSPVTRTISGESAIPFSIPLHPTPKTYRSQSYSVGQMDPELLGLMASTAGTGAPYAGGRSRGPGQMSAVQPRSARPSVLGELGHDPATLGQLREDEDGDDDDNGADDGNYSASQARTIEQLARENAMLRQAAAGQMDSRFRDRASSSASVAGAAHALHRIHGSVPEESDLAVEDIGELRDIQGYSNMRSNTRRRFSEHSANLEPQFSSFASPLDNRALDNVRKAHWQTSLGFGSLVDVPQSRRHSFADIPVRHTSAGSVDAHAAGPRPGMGDREENYDYSNSPMQPPSFYPREQTLRGDGSSGIPTSLNQYGLSGAYGRQPGLSHAHQNQLLYIVTFKCHRADVFYIQEDTGLQVKAGDLVIVEADRGTDLGTVQHANVSLQKARELKQQYAEEHYKWLMMFSRQGQLEASSVASPTGGISGLGRSATGGMGPHGPHGVQEPTTDIKPKLIKRLAQNHEILTLRDKEGNEAKAKRVCQQKVAEHRLNMEILDAEFQMDWKKLTFYYFADSYINFNSLVTDLFKIYKTRIWMSAINPASFVTPPSAGLQGPPSGISNPLYGQDGPHTDRRHQHDGRAYAGARADVDPGREGIPNPMLLRTNYPESYQPFAQPSHQAEGQSDPFSTYSPTSFGPLDTAGYADFSPSGAGSNGASRMHPAQGEWVNRFQGLSLNS
ncbi:hypothetical protein N7510_010541 [Penicillium lagena]|uniref:uncharacterized protein n=1 Tax=Penicillium lagena TaxID=94218 RepID=UPI00253F7DCD|nr:uncharacterized protein N7510_010541 [Penicillium lagena]KAJ5601007.1 hypothetical protein N7510_010541 [Penicillium lagena]